MFKRITYEELVPGAKYKIGSDFTGHYEKIALIYIERTPEMFVEFSKMKKNNILSWRRFVAMSCDFYQFVPQNPQWTMERRSVNIIVRRLIGDDCFEW